MVTINQFANEHAEKAKRELDKIKRGQFEVIGHDSNLAQIERSINSLLPRLKVFEQRTYSKFKVAQTAQEWSERIRKRLQALENKEIKGEKYNLNEIKSQIKKVHKELEILLKLVQEEIALDNMRENIKNDTKIPRAKRHRIFEKAMEKIKRKRRIEQKEINDIAKDTDELLKALFKEQESFETIEKELSELITVGDTFKDLKIETDVQKRVVLAETEEVKQIAVHLHKVARALHQEWGIEDDIYKNLTHVKKDSLF